MATEVELTANGINSSTLQSARAQPQKRLSSMRTLARRNQSPMNRPTLHEQASSGGAGARVLQIPLREAQLLYESRAAVRATMAAEGLAKQFRQLGVASL